MCLKMPDTNILSQRQIHERIEWGFPGIFPSRHISVSGFRSTSEVADAGNEGWAEVRQRRNLFGLNNQCFWLSRFLELKGFH
jgi:hypothetical protein